MPAHAKAFVWHSGEKFWVATSEPRTKPQARRIAKKLRRRGNKARLIKRNSTRYGYAVGVRTDRRRRVRPCDV